MSPRVRRAGALVALALLGAGLIAGPGGLHPFQAVAEEFGRGQGVPFALARPLWTDLPGPAGAGIAVFPGPGDAAAGERAREALRIIAGEQRNGMLRAILGSRPARIVQLGDLQDGGRTVGVTALLALPVPRHDVRATVPAGGSAWTGDLRLRRVRFVAPVLRDVLVDVDLRRGSIVGVEPGPASRTSLWAERWSAVPSAAAVTASRASPPFVRLSPGGPSFAPYDGVQGLGRGGRDWPVSLIFAGHATVAKVKQALRSAGFTHQGERRWLAYGASGQPVGFDGDRGLKTACDANGTDVHLRLYAPSRTDHFADPRFGSVVVATAHLDRGESCTTPPRLFGFSEEAERRVADAVASRLGWRVRHDAVALGNAEPYRRDLAAPDHIWWSDGRATLISVP